LKQTERAVLQAYPCWWWRKPRAKARLLLQSMYRGA
jgi:hypothetical protein